MPNIRFVYLNFDNSLAPNHLKKRRSDNPQASVFPGNRDACIATTQHNKIGVEIIGCEAFCYGILPLRTRADLRSRIAGFEFGSCRHSVRVCRIPRQTNNRHQNGLPGYRVWRVSAAPCKTALTTRDNRGRERFVILRQTLFCCQN